ncbi:MAG: GNAT family N-acetyltransferase [Ktedonobacteraceae bacterium]
MTTHSRNNYALIAHSQSAHLLLLQEGDTWTLPHHTADGAAATNRAIKQALGLEVTILYTVYEHNGEQADDMEAQQIHVLENHSANWQLPATGRWVSANDLSEIKLAVPGHFHIMEQWFWEREQPSSAVQRRSWTQRGWYTTALSWLEEQLTARGYQTREIEQFAVSDWSCILRIQTEQGALYLKCCDPAFPHEPALTQALSQLWPAAVPRVLAIHTDQQWLLMEDAGQVLDEQYPEKARDLACWQEIISAYVNMQKETISQREYLLSQGCPDRRLERLPELFETALADTEMLCLGQEEGITPEELTQLHTVLPRVKAICEKLARYGIPETLHHDDLHAGNIMVNGEHFVFFDWAESCIAHPFYSLAIIQRYTRFFTDKQLNALSEAYLQPWTIYAPMGQLREAFKLAQPLGLLCRGLTWLGYLRSLEPGVRQKYVLNWPHWLQLFLKSMKNAKIKQGETTSMYPHLPANYTVRPPMEEDIAAIIELIYAFEIGEIGEANRSTPDDVRGDWERLDPATDAWCIHAPDGEIAAYGTFWSHDADYGHVTGDGYVHPTHKGRGLGATLLDLVDARALEVAADQPEGTRLVLVNNIVASSAASRSLFEAYDYTLTRVFFTMQVALDKEPVPAVWPEGINVRVCDGGVEDIQRAYEVIEEGFQDHFAHTPRTFEEWQSSMVREGFDPALWFLAMDGEQVAGAALCRVRDPETGLGWVGQLAVLTPWRKRGLGNALLQHAFGVFYQRGLKHVGLGVDGESLTGAQRLYERAGMHVIWRMGRYEKELRAGRDLHPGRINS